MTSAVDDTSVAVYSTEPPRWAPRSDAGQVLVRAPPLTWREADAKRAADERKAAAYLRFHGATGAHAQYWRKGIGTTDRRLHADIWSSAPGQRASKATAF